MIPLRRPVLASTLSVRMEQHASRLRAVTAGPDEARRAWRAARQIRNTLTGTLESMAAGIARCMYCGDSQGTSIDHFQPVAMAPLRVFDWPNHFLACAHCNSHMKRDQYPCNESGSCLLVDPCSEDPYEHIKLILASGEYRPLTRKGTKTIEVFGLERSSLRRGREAAFVRCQAMLIAAARSRASEQSDAALRMESSLLLQPFADVLYAMVRMMHAPGADVVMGADTVEALHQVIIPPFTFGEIIPVQSTHKQVTFLRNH